MTITSYAQNFEDVILWRALKHVERGFYIDIGAQDPVIDSVSLAFYEQGWRGVHIEPTAHYASRIRSARPDEDVVEAAVGIRKGPITFFEISDTGLSTGEQAIAQRHEADGRTVKRVDVPCVPLSEILDRYSDRDIHWLKIDVEGMEEEVLESWDSSPVRPWIVVIESTRPNSSEPNFAAWEPRVVALGYMFAYFDGLNRFYVSVKHPELMSSFGPGPNYFDDFVLSGSASFCHRINLEKEILRQEIQELTETSNSKGEVIAAREAEIDRLHERIREMDAQIEAAAVREAALTEKLEAVYSSVFWRLTMPLRSLGRITRSSLRTMFGEQ